MGYIRRGRFHSLFSAGCLLGSCKLGVDVSLTFEPLDVGHVIYSQPRYPAIFVRTPSRKLVRAWSFDQPDTVRFLEPSQVCAPHRRSRSPESEITFSFELNEKQGAALVTKHPTYREDIELESAFEEYTKHHYDSWVAFAHNARHGNNIKPVLVTGVDMTRDFAMMVYSNNNTHLLPRSTTSSSPSPSALASPWGKWHTQGSVHTNCGPQFCGPPYPNTSNWSPVDAERIDAITNGYDQCVFIRYCTMRKRASMFREVIKAGVSPQSRVGGQSRRGPPGTIEF